MLCRSLRHLLRQRELISSSSISSIISRLESTTAHSGDSEITDEKKVSGFAKAFTKHSHIRDEPVKEDVSFATLLRNSKFIDLGDPEGRIVTGTIFHSIDNDLYIDFGWKFHCVCQRPTKNGSFYVRGAKVKLRIKDLELSTKFLGSEKDLTLLEADAQLLGLVSSPVKTSATKAQQS